MSLRSNIVSCKNPAELLVNAETVSEMLSVIWKLQDELSRRAAQHDGAWQPIETAPMDKDLLLGWWRTWPERQWECAAGLAGSTKGGWLHGQATHWQPLPATPEQKALTTDV